jgi:hypothetical protein
MPETLPSFKPTLTPDEAAQDLNLAYQQISGSAPSAEILALLMAQSALETGNWQSMPNYNFGGIKASSSDPYVQVFQTTEVVNGQTVNEPQTFAAYKDAVSGAAGYVNSLYKRPNWWSGLQSGTPEGFNAGLTSSPAYYTADPTTYLNNLVAGVTKYLPIATQYAKPVSGVDLSLTRVFTQQNMFVLAAVGLFAYGLHTGKLRRGLRKSGIYLPTKWRRKIPALPIPA